MKQKEKDLAKYLRFLVGTMFLVITSLTIIQVFFRFVLNSPLIWSEELVRFTLVWAALLGAAVISYDGKHLAVDSLVVLMPQKVQFLLYVIKEILIYIFLICTAFASIELLRVSHGSTSGALEIPFSYWRGAATVGSVLMLIFGMIRFMKNVRLFINGEFGKKDEQPGEEL